MMLKIISLKIVITTPKKVSDKTSKLFSVSFYFKKKKKTKGIRFNFHIVLFILFPLFYKSLVVIFLGCYFFSSVCWLVSINFICFAIFIYLYHFNFQCSVWCNFNSVKKNLNVPQGIIFWWWTKKRYSLP